MLSSFAIQHYKSIVDLELPLGRFNLFIGENGGGKTNILEAFGMAAAYGSRRTTNEELSSLGIRVARPSLTVSAFPNLRGTALGRPEFAAADRKLGIHASFVDIGDISFVIELSEPVHLSSVQEQVAALLIERALASSAIRAELIDWEERLKHGESTPEPLHVNAARAAVVVGEALRGYGIYCASTLALRGLQRESRREPLGLFGEGLDVAIAQLPPDRRARLLEHVKVIGWLDDIDIDVDGKRKLEGYKPGRSLSDLYFIDRFLASENRVFSAENANEGVLHLLFHLVLFMHPETPRIFAIDNIETALNPHLLRHLVKTLAELARTEDRQALVTTHNPAALDGLNLHDDDQRLFVVSRNDDGHTQIRRVQVKPESATGSPRLKLSEMWMRGMLGAIPTHF